MNASKLFTAIAALAFAGATFAAETTPAAAATTSAAAAAQVAVAAKSAAVPAPADKAVRTREQARAEAIEAMNNRRATEASQFDWFMK
jgi:hypothetical protein